MLDAYVELPVDPTDEELARDWTLSVPDLEEVRKARGPEHRQRFAIQLCALRALGRFVDALYRGVVDVALIREQYDALVRIASSLRNRTAPAHVVLERLAASSDRPARALTMLGRLVKTIHILRYLQDAAIRGRVQLQLNRGESRHELARRLFFANQGAFRTGDYEEIMNKVSALAVLSNAVLVWNTVRMTEILRALQTTSGAPAEATDVARISPLAHAHVIPSGTYHFARATDDAASVA